MANRVAKLARCLLDANQKKTTLKHHANGRHHTEKALIKAYKLAARLRASRVGGQLAEFKHPALCRIVLNRQEVSISDVRRMADSPPETVHQLCIDCPPTVHRTVQKSVWHISVRGKWI